MNLVQTIVTPLQSFYLTHSSKSFFPVIFSFVLFLSTLELDVSLVNTQLKTMFTFPQDPLVSNNSTKQVEINDVLPNHG